VKRFAAENLSEEGRMLISRMYFEERSLSEIQSAIKAQTGEHINVSSLHRYCRRKLGRGDDDRIVMMKRHHASLISVLRGTPGLSDCQIGLVAALSLVLDIHSAILTQRFADLAGILRELILGSPPGKQLKPALKAPQRPFTPRSN
jgi:hypothetical protein